MALVATKDSNLIYSAYDITFSAQINTQHQNHSFYSEPLPLSASAVYTSFDTSWEDQPSPFGWREKKEVFCSNKAVHKIFGVACEVINEERRHTASTLISVFLPLGVFSPL